MADEPDGFFGRWAKRKALVREGRVVQEPVREATAGAEPTVNACATADPVATPPVPTLADAQALTRDSNFIPFMSKQVQPEVRNAAMKTLFSDPHFNVMDGLDIYIDDYTKSEPIPESMLRQMVGAQFLKLFDGAPVETLAAPSPGAVDTAVQPTLPLSPTPSDDVEANNHDNPHLRLQPDHATEPTPVGGRVA